MKRNDDYEARREHLAKLSDEELKARFWNLAQQLVDPMLKMGYENTTPAIERSVVLRMGFSSIEAKKLVDGCMERNLIEHGVGNVIYRLAKDKKIEIRAAGEALCDGKYWDDAQALFTEVK